MKSKVIYGLHAVKAALIKDSSNVKTLFIQEKRHDLRIFEIVELADAMGIKKSYVSKKKLDELTGDSVHQGVVAYLQNHQSVVTHVEAVLDNLMEPALLLILDGVQDPHNLGACLRSANAAGVHAVIAPKDNAVAITPVVRKVASGAAEVTPFITVTNLARTLQALKDRGVWIYGASDDASNDIYNTNLTGPIALVLGAEGSGLRRLTREYCDGLMRIPMYGTVTSLNVSVAAGVCLFEAVRQRSEKS